MITQQPMHFLQSPWRNAEEQPAAGLGIGEEKAPRNWRPFPLHQCTRSLEVFLRAARNTIVLDQLEKLFADHRDIVRENLRTDAACATH